MNNKPPISCTHLYDATAGPCSICQKVPSRAKTWDEEHDEQWREEIIDQAKQYLGRFLVNCAEAIEWRLDGYRTWTLCIDLRAGDYVGQLRVDVYQISIIHRHNPYYLRQMIRELKMNLVEL